MKLFPLPVWRGLLAGRRGPVARAGAGCACADHRSPRRTSRPNVRTPPRRTASDDADAPDLTQPVATVNGVTVYRPLMRSIVSNPVDRALLIFAYRKSGLHMSASDKDLVTQQLELSQFNGSDKRLDAKLKTLGATRDDYKPVSPSRKTKSARCCARSRAARVPRVRPSSSSAEYLAQLRNDAAINTTRQ